MIEYGLTDDDISNVRFFIMGDDNSGFTNWTLPQVERFAEFTATYAKTRYNMTINTKKCILTDNRQYIETLSYQCNLGFPTRPIDKLVAQLCYPEYGRVPKYMSYRAIGLAYASCGMNLKFYQLCKDVFNIYRTHAVPLDEHAKSKIQRYGPGIFRTLEILPHYLTELQFPTLHQIQTEISYWHGPLSLDPK